MQTGGVAAASLLVRSFVTPRLLSLSAPNTPRHWLSEPPEKAACLALAWPGMDMIRSSIILGNVDMISVPLGKMNMANILPLKTDMIRFSLSLINVDLIKSSVHVTKMYIIRSKSSTVL